MKASKTVAVLGPQGTFSHHAAQSYFGHSPMYYGKNLVDVFGAIISKQADFGVVPIENSTNGTVGQTLDLLVEYNDHLRIVGEVFVPVEHCVAVRSSDVSQISRIYSHPQALDQCARHLLQRYPHAELLETGSTADAMRKVTFSNEGGIAAIGPAFCAAFYGLRIIEHRMQDADNNYTIFFIIGTDMNPQENADRTTICVDVSDRRDKPGTLVSLLKPIADLDINLSYIQSRPAGAARHAYRFFFTLDGPPESDDIRLAIRYAKQIADIKTLGSYKSAQVET